MKKKVDNFPTEQTNLKVKTFISITYVINSYWGVKKPCINT